MRDGFLHNAALANRYLIANLAVWLLVLAGTLFPEANWGFHFLAFLPAAGKWGMLILSLALIVAGGFVPDPTDPVRGPERATWARFWPLPVALGFGLLTYNLAPSFDLYGDAQRFLGFFKANPKSVDFSRIFSPNVFSSKNGEITILNSVYLISGKNTNQFIKSFQLLDSIFAILYALVGLFFLDKYFKSAWWKAIFGLAFLCAPFTGVFFGHVEIYAPGFMSLTALMACLALYFVENKSVWLWLSLLAAFFALKFHSSTFLVLPVVGLAFIFHFFPRVRPWFTWKKLGFLYLSAGILGWIGLYFFILKDHADPRFTHSGINPTERIFLPLISPDPPLDRYNLQSWNHLYDFFNQTIFWSLPFLGLGLTPFLFVRKKAEFSSPFSLLAGLTFLGYALFFYAVNPLLGMAFDWDLFSFPAIPLLFLIAARTREIESEFRGKSFFPAILGLSLIAFSLNWVNFNPVLLSQRVESMGRHSFKTYWIYGIGHLKQGILIAPRDVEETLSRYLNNFQELEPYAIPGKDVEFSVLALEIAKIYRSEIKDYPKALSFHRKAIQYDPELPANYLGLMECQFLLRNYQEAYQTAMKLIQLQYPTQQKAGNIAIHIALEGQMYQEALKLSGDYVQVWPDDQVVQTVFQRLQTGDRIDELKDLFR